MALLCVGLSVGRCSIFPEDPVWDTSIPESAAIDANLGTWDPTGTRIYFQYSDMASDGSGPRDFLWAVDLQENRLTSVFDAPVLNIDVSPDGRHILFHSPTLPQYLYTYDQVDHSLIRLSGESSSNLELENTVAGRWSPTGSSILFTIEAGEPRGVAVMNRDGTGARIIVPYGVNASWYPDGQKIVYVNWDLTERDETRSRQIYVCNPDGTGIQRLTYLDNSDAISVPTVSPDGNRIAFVHLKNGESLELYLMNIDGTDIRQITEGPGYVDRPEWHPDGSRLLFTRVIPNVSNRMYVVEATSYEVEPVFPLD